VVVVVVVVVVTTEVAQHLPYDTTADVYSEYYYH